MSENKLHHKEILRIVRDAVVDLPDFDTARELAETAAREAGASEEQVGEIGDEAVRFVAIVTGVGNP